MDELRLMRAHAALRLWPATKCAAKEFGLSLRTRHRAADGVLYTLREYCDYYGTFDGVWVLYERLQVEALAERIERLHFVMDGSIEPFTISLAFGLSGNHIDTIVLASNREPVHEIKKALDCGLYADEGVAMLSINEEWANADRPSYWLHYDHACAFIASISTPVRYWPITTFRMVPQSTY